MKTSFAGIDMGSEQFSVDVAGRLADVEDLLIGELTSGADFLAETATHLARAGGKRFRPLFTILSAHFGPDPDNRGVITAAAVVELVHLATLYHDDVMDEAPMRRGTESANSRWSNSVAILAGDFLFARASRLVSTLGPESVRIIAETFADLVTGQMRETIGARDEDVVEHYLRVIWEKTASLIAACGRFGGMASGADDEQIERLSRLGDAVGTAFQLSDDIIDIASLSADSGKTPGTDLREGVHTLPVLYALADTGPDSDRLRVLLAGPVTDDADVEEALMLLRRSAGMTRARAKLESYADAARTELALLPRCPAGDAMDSLVQYTIDRVG